MKAFILMLLPTLAIAQAFMPPEPPALVIKPLPTNSQLTPYNRAFMTDWFERRNQKVIDALPRERLLVFSPTEGWEPLCSFLGVPLPDEPFPRINRRDELSAQLQGGVPPDPETAERSARDYIEKLKTKAFGG